MSKLTSSLLVAITAFLAGEASGSDAVFEHFRGDVAKVASLELRSWDLVEDVVQETFLDAFGSGGPADWDGQDLDVFRRWLLRIARNRCLRVFDERRRRRAASLQEEESVAVPFAEFERVDREDEVELRLGVLSRLDSLGAKVIRMTWLQELPAAVVAARLELQRQTVYNRTHRALGQLRRLAGSGNGNAG